MKININGIEEEVSDNVYKELNDGFSTLEGLRVRLCQYLGLDYLSATDDDAFRALDKLIKESKTCTYCAE